MQVIVTSTYHGMFWGTLLQRKVVVVNAFSSKFFTFRYPPAMYAGDLDAGTHSLFLWADLATFFFSLIGYLCLFFFSSKRYRKPKYIRRRCVNANLRIWRFSSS
jgi:hypothetical protein